MKAKKAKSGIFKIIFSRTALVAVLLLFQIGLMVATITTIEQYAFSVYVGFIVLSMIVIIYIINRKENPAFKMSWILFVTFIPIVGTVFYIFMQIQPGTRYIGKRLFVLGEKTKPYMVQNDKIIEDLRISKPANANLAHYLSKQVGFPVHRNTKVTYFRVGEEKFEELKRQLESAKYYIFMEYFIVEEGIMWDSILEILKRKVEEGVEVRFMYDGMCSIVLLPYKYPKKLEEMGIRCKMFSPIKPVLSTHQNNRDHRKICVIDGQVAFTGGINLADEYINEKERFGHWKDTAVMLQGEAVQNFTMMFLQMWNVTEKKEENFEKYLTPKSKEFRRELGYVLPYGDSPYDNENIGEQVYFHILNHAKKYVHIMTPYLILDNEMVINLTYAAKCGIEVIIIMPHIPDKWYAFVLAKTYYEELINAGVQIYEYTPGFVHAKVFVSDDDTATVGTINLDYRSLYLHFECGTFIYNNQVVRDIEKDFQDTLKKCQRVTITDLRMRGVIETVAGRVLRLIAPLM
ncbi:cardiolipin synthase [Faecalimonas canis]